MTIHRDHLGLPEKAFMFSSNSGNFVLNTRALKNSVTSKVSCLLCRLLQINGYCGMYGMSYKRWVEMIKIPCMFVLYSQIKYYITKPIDLSPNGIFIFCKKTPSKLNLWKHLLLKSFISLLTDSSDSQKSKYTFPICSTNLQIMIILEEFQDTED